jgi:hypothetical protein
MTRAGNIPEVERSTSVAARNTAEHPRSNLVVGNNRVLRHSSAPADKVQLQGPPKRRPPAAVSQVPQPRRRCGVRESKERMDQTPQQA